MNHRLCLRIAPPPLCCPESGPCKSRPAITPRADARVQPPARGFTIAHTAPTTDADANTRDSAGAETDYPNDQRFRLDGSRFTRLAMAWNVRQEPGRAVGTVEEPSDQAEQGETDHRG